MHRFRTLTTNFTKILICGLFLFLLTACAGPHVLSEGHDTKDKSKITKDNVTIKPSGMHEECFELKKQQKLFYKFNSDKPVDFNVHFHAKDVVHYPVQQNGATQSDGMIDPEDKRFHLNTQEYYCLMWENPAMGPVNLSYECSVEKK